jgi:serine phosphatase RsbU (regulator of sigma subunit)/anti-sigma regulatory factor (Ser/Thr protein kinase)
MLSSIKIARPSLLRITFDSDLTAAREVSVAVHEFLSDHGMPEKEIFSYELCIAEACYNAVEYASGDALQMKPVAEVSFANELIELRVVDHTLGFDLKGRVPQPSPLNERGRGLFLMQAVMDEVQYLRGDGVNTLVMRKRRRAGEPLTGSQAPVIGQQLAEARQALESMTGELSIRSDILSAVFRCCAEMGRSGEAAEKLGERLLSDLLRLTSADWYVLRLLSPDGRQLVVSSASGTEVSAVPIEVSPVPESATGIEARVAATRESARFAIRECSDVSEPLIAVGSEATGLVHPLCFGDSLVGTLAVGSHSGEFRLGRLQEEVVRAFAEFLAIQTINMRSRGDEVRNRVVAREFEIAKEIQLLLLPRILPQIAGFGLAGGWHSARQVGGDFYDAISLGSHSLLLMMVDVMGKGVPAALFATTLRGLLRGLASRSADPGQLLGNLNRLLHKDLSAVNMFMTVQIAHVDFARRKITAAGAGHCPLLVVQAGRGTVSALTTHGVPIGVLPDTTYINSTETLSSPAAALLYTDGLTDSRNSEGKMYGHQKLMDWMKDNAIPGRTAAELRDLLTTELASYRANTEMTDDQAFLVLAEENAGAPPTETQGRLRIHVQPGSFLFPTRA